MSFPELSELMIDDVVVVAVVGGGAVVVVAEYEEKYINFYFSIFSLTLAIELLL